MGECHLDSNPNLGMSLTRVLSNMGVLQTTVAEIVTFKEHQRA